jgi:hypothetical protein
LKESGHLGLLQNLFILIVDQNLNKKAPLLQAKLQRKYTGSPKYKYGENTCSQAIYGSLVETSGPYFRTYTEKNIL